MARKRAKASAGTAANGGRRLVVVVAFDVVNFTALVEADEERVLAAWRALRQAIDPLITAGGGRIFKALGDGLLVEFTGPVDATRTALAVQEAVARASSAAAGPTAVRLELRCAIHMGEVTVEGTDLLGDGINVVSRLQEHAPIGGVLVSAAVMDLISGRIEQPIEELGPLVLRNMSRPVHAYAVGTGRRPATASMSPSAPAAATPFDSFQRRRPSIAVLPFVDQAEDGGASWFSDGLVEAIIAALSCLPELVVISRASVLRYRGRVHDPRLVQRELAVRYMLTGSVRRAPGPGGVDRVRLSAELCDCETGTAIWSDRFAGGATDLFSLQDELSTRVAATIAPQVQESELRRVLRKHPESLDAYESVLRGLDLLYRQEHDPWARALPLFERAMALDPRYAAAYALAATCHGERFYEGNSPDPVADHTEAERLSRLALSFDRFDPLALSLVRPYPVVAVPRLRPRDRAVRPGAGDQSQLGHRLAAQQRHLLLHRRAARGAAARRDRAQALALRCACVLLLWAGRARGLRQRRLCRGGVVGAARHDAQSALRRQPALPRRESGGQRPVQGGARGRPAPAGAEPGLQRAHIRRRACVQGCREATAVRRSPGAGGAAGIVAGSAPLRGASLLITQPMSATGVARSRQ